MNQNDAPLLTALTEYHGLGRYGFTPPGHRQGAGADDNTRGVLGEEVFRSDVLSSGGLDDRTSSGGYLATAEQLMADAVGARSAFFSTCGSSLSVKAAMMAVAGADGTLLLTRDAHKSALRELTGESVDLPRAASIRLAGPDELELESVVTPRQAFFGRAEMVDAAAAAGRIAAERMTPYHPGIPAVVPGERLNEAVISYLRTGLSAGMVIPDATDGGLGSFRVLAEQS